MPFLSSACGIYIAELTSIVRDFAAQGPFFPGNNPTTPPHLPAAMPYKPYRCRNLNEPRQETRMPQPGEPHG